MAKSLKTRTQCVQDYLLEQLQIGTWKSGDVLPSSDELAETLGVSKFTLREGMMPLVRDGIIARRTKVGTYVCEKASNLGADIILLGSVNNNGSIAGYADQDSMNIAAALMTEHGHQYKIATGLGDNLESFMNSLHIFSQDIVRDTLGVINLVGYLPVEKIEETGVPCVSISATITNRKNEAILDVGAVFKSGMDVLLSHGFDEIGIVKMDFSSISAFEGPYSQSRDNAIETESLRVQREHKGIKVLDIPFVGVNYAVVYNLFREFMVNNPNIQALFIADDSFIPEVHRVIEDMGIVVPDDLKILCWSMKGRDFGFDMNWTRFEQDGSAGIKLAYEILMECVDGNTGGIKRMFRPSFVKGNSL